MKIALIGANGHGHWHRRELARRPWLDLVGMCDLTPIGDAENAPVPAHTYLGTDYRELLEHTKPDIAIICTPPHTHLDIASTALRAGCDVLLEKPPVRCMDEHAELLEVVAATGRSCQVGFQALGSAALAELLDTIAQGALGTVTAIAAVASWQRPDAYYTRSPWAGRRRLDGQHAVDGALVNPLAHAVMQTLAIAQAVSGSITLTDVELERYRVRPIEVEDTGFLRVRVGDLPVVIAVTLCGEDFIPGEIVVSGTAGRALLEYPTDKLALPGGSGLRPIAGRHSLLDNLVAHRGDREVPLIAPLARTAPFTALLEAIGGAPDPVEIPGDLVTVTGGETQRHRTIRGVNEILRRCARELALPNELGVAWAKPANPLTILHA